MGRREFRSGGGEEMELTPEARREFQTTFLEAYRPLFETVPHLEDRAAKAARLRDGLVHVVPRYLDGPTYADETNEFLRAWDGANRTIWKLLERLVQIRSETIREDVRHGAEQFRVIADRLLERQREAATWDPPEKWKLAHPSLLAIVPEFLTRLAIIPRTIEEAIRNTTTTWVRADLDFDVEAYHRFVELVDEIGTRNPF